MRLFWIFHHPKELFLTLATLEQGAANCGDENLRKKLCFRLHAWLFKKSNPSTFGFNKSPPPEPFIITPSTDVM
jgi:hypothetical protein